MAEPLRTQRQPRTPRMHSKVAERLLRPSSSSRSRPHTCPPLPGTPPNRPRRFDLFLVWTARVADPRRTESTSHEKGIGSHGVYPHSSWLLGSEWPVQRRRCVPLGRVLFFRSPDTIKLSNFFPSAATFPRRSFHEDVSEFPATILPPATTVGTRGITIWTPKP